MSKLMRGLVIFSVLLAAVSAVSAQDLGGVVEEAHALLATKQVDRIEQAIELLETSLDHSPEDAELFRWQKPICIWETGAMITGWLYLKPAKLMLIGRWKQRPLTPTATTGREP